MNFANMGLAKLARVDVFSTLHPSSSPPPYSLDYIKVEYRLYKKKKKNSN